jgi:hypothetical protein
LVDLIYIGTLNLGTPMRHAHSTTYAPARSGNEKFSRHVKVIENPHFCNI